jgi:tRNA threonylcarbamoyl adenosine modification protein (Sua5/YciO/YrdC/YwlC family)
MTGSNHVVGTDAAGLEAAAAALRAGEPIVVPTDTVYGLAVIAGDAAALDRLFELKRRPRERSIAVLVADRAQAESLAAFTPGAIEAGDAHWPGALTLVVDRHAQIDASVGRDDGTVGVRCPGHDFVRALAHEVGPLATTSANLSGEATPEEAVAAAEALDGDVAVIVDGGVCRGTASTVARIAEDGVVTVFRQGEIELV